MNNLKYVKLSEVNPDYFISLLNSPKIRKHLIEHELFNAGTVKDWINSKIEIDTTQGCRVRGIMYKNQLAGWCGIQIEDGKYEIAIVIDNKFWGLGRRVFHDIMCWAKELGHDEVFIHFLHTRPGYKFLQKISENVSETELHNNKFTTYQLAVK